MHKPSLDELETLLPPEDAHDDATMRVSAGDLRAFVALIPEIRAAEALRDSLDADDQDIQSEEVWVALKAYDKKRGERNVGQS
jgi:hypothetical protein